VTASGSGFVMEQFVTLLECLLGKARNAKNIDLDGFVRSKRKATAQ